MMDLSWTRPKLAELCGLTLMDGRDDERYRVHPSGMAWEPDEDVAQAVRCLEAMNRPVSLWWPINPVEGWVGQGWAVSIGNPEDAHTGTTLPRAICLAIAAALGWEA